jgi:toxin secretion/phage lysis holin
MNFEKLFNSISVLSGSVGGILAGLMGGWDGLLAALITLVVLDYITGLAKAVCQKELSSKIGFRGIVKKIVLFILVAAANALQLLLSGSLPLREIVLVFFIANEGLSLLENAAVFVPIPSALKRVFLQLRDKSEK